MHAARDSIADLQLTRLSIRVGRAPSRETGHRLTVQYQGRLAHAGRPAEGAFDVGLLLHDNPISPEPCVPPAVRRSVTLQNGEFSVVVDFDRVVSPRDLWLAVGVRRSDGPKEAVHLFARESLATVSRPSIGSDSAQFSL